LDVSIDEIDTYAMDSAEIVAVVVLGVVSGAINVIAGAGSLLTYPLLIALGLPPVAANVSNDIGMVPGNLSGVMGLRGDLTGQRQLLRTLVPRAMVGSVIGAGALLLAPGSAFAWVAPPLLLLASGLTLGQPMLARRTRRDAQRGRLLHLSVDATSVYGGYFGTGIGLMFMAVLGVFRDETPAQLNAVKTVLQLVANGLAGVVFALVAPVDWPAAAALACGSVAGGQLGARLARHVSASMLRTIVASVGIAAAVWLASQQLLH
jgi:uncharacterized protein